MNLVELPVEPVVCDAVLFCATLATGDDVGPVKGTTENCPGTPGIGVLVDGDEGCVGTFVGVDDGKAVVGLCDGATVATDVLVDSGIDVAVGDGGTS